MPPRAPKAPPRGTLGHLGAILKAFWDVWGRGEEGPGVSWGVMKASWERLGVICKFPAARPPELWTLKRWWLPCPCLSNGWLFDGTLGPQHPSLAAPGQFRPNPSSLPTYLPAYLPTCLLAYMPACIRKLPPAENTHPRQMKVGYLTHCNSV